MSLQLLPSGGFEITLKDATIIKGQFNAASLKKFSLLKGGLGFTDTVSLITDKADMPNFLQFILCAAEGNHTEFDVLEWIEQMGGVGSDEWLTLLGHVMDAYVSKKKIVTEAQ